MNGKQYIQAAQVLPSRINEPSKGKIRESEINLAYMNGY